MKRSERCNVIIAAVGGLASRAWAVWEARGQLLARGASWCPPQRVTLLLNPACHRTQAHIPAATAQRGARRLAA